MSRTNFLKCRLVILILTCDTNPNLCTIIRRSSSSSDGETLSESEMEVILYAMV